MVARQSTDGKASARVIAYTRHKDGRFLRVVVVQQVDRPFVRIVRSRVCPDGSMLATGDVTAGVDELEGLISALRLASLELPAPEHVNRFHFIHKPSQAPTPGLS